jgi:hypothetical protein
MLINQALMHFRFELAYLLPQKLFNGVRSVMMKVYVVQRQIQLNQVVPM